MNIPDDSRYILFGGSFVLANKLQWVADQRVAGLSTKQWFLLRTLHDMPAEPLPTISALAGETDTSRQNVAKMLEVLSRQGCVTLGNSPSDHRSRTVALTAHGRQLLGGMAGAARPFFAELFAGICAEECDAAARVVIKLIGNLNAMQQELREQHD